MIDVNAKFRRSNRVIARRVAGEVVLVPTDSRSTRPEHKAADLFVLNESGALLWDALSADRSKAELAEQLSREFDVSARDAEADVTVFLQAMVDINAVLYTEDESWTS